VSETANDAVAPCALELRELRKSFGKTEIIRGASLAVKPGERVAIIGPNGAGKSTLFNLISGRFAPSGGEMRLHGQRIDGRKPYEINRLGLSRSFQVSNLFIRLSVFENIRCAVLWSWATATRSGSSWPAWTTPTNAPSGAGDDQARQEARRAGDEPHLRRAARAGNRHHDRRRLQRDPARRADGGHEPERNQARCS
jgi:ABC-type branched-subunit amino acid transport system ATPase component